MKDLKTKHNPVAKHAGINRAATHKDRKRALKRGERKHKTQEQQL